MCANQPRPSISTSLGINNTLQQFYPYLYARLLHYVLILQYACACRTVLSCSFKNSSHIFVARFLRRIADSLECLLKSGADREPVIIEQVLGFSNVYRLQHYLHIRSEFNPFLFCRFSSHGLVL